MALHKTPSQVRRDSLLRTARALFEEGRVDGSIALLEDAVVRYPEHSIFSFELGRNAYYRGGSPYDTMAFVLLDSVVALPDAKEMYYLELSSLYEMEGKVESALEVVENGLERFPRSGALLTKTGKLYFYKKKEPEPALYYWNRAMRVAPGDPSSYFELARIYLHSDDLGWGLILGEIFLNLEPESARSMEIRNLLFRGYNDAVIVGYKPGDDKDSIIRIRAFEPRMWVHPGDDSLHGDFSFFYHHVLDGAVHTSLIRFFERDTASFVLPDRESVAMLSGVRRDFLRIWKSIERLERVYNMTLYRYQQQLQSAGLFEAYNYYLLANPSVDEEIAEWDAVNGESIPKLKAWMKAHPYPYADNPFLLDSLPRVPLSDEEVTDPFNLWAQ